MKEIIIGLLGACVVGIVIEVLLPDKTLKKNCIFALSIISAMIVISPIINTFNNGDINSYSYDSFKWDNAENTYVENDELLIKELAVRAYLLDEGIASTVNIEYVGDDVKYIGVSLDNLDDSQKVKEDVSKILNVPQSMVNVYG